MWIRTILASVLLFSWGCTRIEGTTVVAEVGTTSVTVASLQQAYRLQEIPGDLPPHRTPQEIERKKRQILNVLVEHHLLLQQVHADGIELEPDIWEKHKKQLLRGYETELFKQQLKDRGLTLEKWQAGQKEKLLIQHWIAEQVARHDGLSTTELKSYYQNNQRRFLQAEKVRALHIVVATRHEADDLLRRLKQGDDFIELARQFSTGPEATEGGDLGYFTRKDYPPTFTDTCFALKKGEHSEIVASDYGFHLFKVVDRLPPQQQSYKKVLPQIKRQLTSQKMEDWMATTLQSLRQKAPIKIHHDILRKVRL